MSTTAAANLFAPYNLEKLNLSHRVVLAPLTRCRAPNGMPQPSMVEYYKQRATEGGLSLLKPRQCLRRLPGIHVFLGSTTTNRSKVGRRWSTPSIRRAGSSSASSGTPAVPLTEFVCINSVYSGAVYQPDEGEPFSSTDTPISEKWKILLPDGTHDLYSAPRALDTAEVPVIVEEFRRAATYSVRAGFDGIEVHGAHDYLIDQFLKETINDRVDIYGGSVENRLRLLMEILQGVVGIFVAERVGVRISPVSEYNDATVPDPLSLGMSIIEALNEFQTQTGTRLCYLHVTQPRFLTIPAGQEEEQHNEEDRLMRAWREAYKGSFMTSGGFTRELGMKALADGYADLIAYGRLFISNPDLVRRFRVDAPLNAYDRDTFYTGDPVVGYTDYSFLGG